MAQNTFAWDSLLEDISDSVLEDISGIISQDLRWLVDGIRKDQHETPILTWMVLIDPRINQTVRRRLVDDGILEVLKGVITDPRITVDSVDEMGNPFWTFLFLAWHNLTGIHLADLTANRQLDSILDAIVKDRNFLKTIVRLFDLHSESNGNIDIMRRLRTTLISYLNTMLNFNESGPNSWVPDIPHCIGTVARLWMLSNDPPSDDDGRTEWTSANTFIMALKGASPQRIQNINLQRSTGFTYEQLMKNYTRLVSRKDLPLQIRLVQFEVFVSWPTCDSSELLHTMMCEEMPSTVWLLREATNNAILRFGLRNLAVTVWMYLLERPSSHRIHDIAKVVAAGLILLVGEWIVDAAADEMAYIDRLLAQFCKFASENPVTGVRIAADLDVTATKALASPQSQGGVALASLTKVIKVSRVLNESIQISAGECAGIHCRNAGTMLCSGCNVVPYCSPKCQKENWKMYHKMQCKTAEIFKRN